MLLAINMYPFTLQFDNGLYACFPFIFNKEPVVSIGNNSRSKNPAPSCLISERSAGDMVFRLAASNNKREEFFSFRGIPAEKVYSLYQIHSKNVFSLGQPQSEDQGILPHPSDFAQEGDGMVSFSPFPILAITVADCLPVFLLDTENGYFALVHSGLKGTGIVLNALDIMQKAGSRPEAIAAVLGPCIQGCCYKVDKERAVQFDKEFGAVRHEPSGSYISLQAANARLLTARGVQHIAYCTDCTFCDERLGSFRREGPQSFTRMIAMISPANYG